MNTSLGSRITPDGAHFSLYAPAATSVTLCVLDESGTHEAHHHAARPGAQGLWHTTVTGLAPGTLYGYRVDGPWEVSAGYRFNERKFLTDPYALAVVGSQSASPALAFTPSLFGHEVDANWQPADPLASTRSDSDSLASAPRSVLLPHTSGHRMESRVPWENTVIYEAHVKGLTKQHPDVPQELQGTYAGLAHPSVLKHLTSLGVTTVELLPIAASAPEPHLARRGATNYWGYSTLGFFAPEPRYATAKAQAAGPHAVCQELREAVEALHAAGLEVIMDVVYNHTCEGGITGPTVSWRGLDAPGYYRLDSDGADVDTTGCGGSLNFDNAAVIAMTMDSLRHWVTAYGIDGFRFDLAPTLARTSEGYSPDHPWLLAMRQDPILSQVKLIAEPWDVGNGGWRTGQFPTPFSEWNDAFRDDVRSFWLQDFASNEKGDEGHIGGEGTKHLATRLAGSADMFHFSSAHDRLRRNATASINFVTAHDGFTLADLTSYSTKHNLANGEMNNDGSDNNRSWNHGAEGPTTDEAITQSRFKTMRALFGTLMLSRGVPMMVAGDEFANTQGGNNNPYCLDSETSWLDWSWLSQPESPQALLVQTVGALTTARSSLTSVLPRSEHQARSQLHWHNADADRMSITEWDNPTHRVVQLVMHSDETEAVLIVNGSTSDQQCRLPELTPDKWVTCWDSHIAGAGRPAQRIHRPGAHLVLSARSMKLLVPEKSH